jgi:hypothetical protein
MPNVPQYSKHSTPLISLGHEGLEKMNYKTFSTTLCSLCKCAFTDMRPPVLLKSGHRLHLDCYFKLFNAPKGEPQ